MNAFHDALDELRSRIRATESEETTQAVYRAVLIELDADTTGNTHHESHAFMRYGRGGRQAAREYLQARLLEEVGEHEAVIDRMLEEFADPLFDIMTDVLRKFRFVVDLLSEEGSSDSDESSDSESSDTDMP
jgi:hypothetical protein